jgi:hypothetical protein
MNWQHLPELFNYRTRIIIEKCCTNHSSVSYPTFVVTMHRQSILDPYSGLSAWKSHQQISKGEKSLLVNGTVREQSLDSAQTDGFSRGAPHRKLEPSSIQLKASRVLLDTRKSPRNQLRQNFLVVCWAPRLHGLLVDSVVGARLR